MAERLPTSESESQIQLKSHISEEQGKQKLTDVITLSFCESNLLPEDKMGKETMEELNTYAEFKNDPSSMVE